MSPDRARTHTHSMYVCVFECVKMNEMTCKSQPATEACAKGVVVQLTHIYLHTHAHVTLLLPLPRDTNLAHFTQTHTHSCSTRHSSTLTKHSSSANKLKRIESKVLASIALGGSMQSTIKTTTCTLPAIDIGTWHT